MLSTAGYLDINEHFAETACVDTVRYLPSDPELTKYLQGFAILQALHVFAHRYGFPP